MISALIWIECAEAKVAHPAVELDKVHKREVHGKQMTLHHSRTKPFPGLIAITGLQKMLLLGTSVKLFSIHLPELEHDPDSSVSVAMIAFNIVFKFPFHEDPMLTYPGPEDGEIMIPIA